MEGGSLAATRARQRPARTPARRATRRSSASTAIITITHTSHIDNKPISSNVIT